MINQWRVVGREQGQGAGTAVRAKVTLEKEEARRLLREMVMARMAPLVEAQIANAMGIKYLVVRDKKTGKFLRVTEAMAKVKLGQDEEIIEVWEKDPSVRAFTDLMNRTIDKAVETLAATLTVPDLAERIKAARKRAMGGG
jgi:hypothetical protein